MLRTQISLTEEQAGALRKLSAVRQRSQAALLRDALDDLLADSERVRRIDRSRRAIGAYRSGTAETSEQHDQSLDDAFSA